MRDIRRNELSAIEVLLNPAQVVTYIHGEKFKFNGKHLETCNVLSVLSISRLIDFNCMVRL